MSPSGTAGAASVPRGHERLRGRSSVARWPLTADLSAGLGLAVASLLFYYPLVFLGRALVDYDAFVYFYPQRVFLARSLLAGQIPLWDPYLFLGAPFLANPQAAVLYPPSWLFLLGPVHTMYAAQLVLHAFLAAWFTYLLARRAFDALPLAAAAGGLAYAFGGFAVGQVGHLNQVSAAAWLPAVLLAYDRFVCSRRPHWLAFGALALGLQLLAGHPQETYMTLIVLAIFGAVRVPWRNRRLLTWCIVGGACMCALGAMLAAAQLLPTLELTPLSIRGAGVSWRDAVAGSLPTYLAVRALLPPFWIQVPFTEYLGYTGVTAISLGLLAVGLGRSRAVVFGGSIAFLGLFLALGENNSLYALVFQYVPGFDTFRVPARWLLLWEFGGAILATAGADWIARGSMVRLHRPATWARLMIAACIVIAAVTWQRTEGEPFAQRRTPLAYAAIAAATLGVAALPRLGRPALAASLLVGMTAIELWLTAGGSPAREAPPPAFTDGESLDWLRAHGATDQDRLLSLARPEYVPGIEDTVRAQLEPLPEPLIEAVLVAQKWRDTLTPNVPLEFGLSTADGYDGGVLPLLRWLDFSSLVVSAPRPDGVLLTRLDSVPSARVLDLLGVRYVIANADTPPALGMQTVEFGDLELFVRPDPVPRSLVVFGASGVADEAAGLHRLAEPDFDSNREVVLEGRDVSVPSVRPGQPVQPDRVSDMAWHAHVSLPEDGFLLQREAWYPGWRARVDGLELPMLRADVLFRAVPLAAGEHDVDIVFDSSSFKRGALLSLAGLLIMTVMFSWRRLPLVRSRVRS